MVYEQHPPPPARLCHGQPVSPRRLMAHRLHLDSFISCFQNDISLATEDQQARREQRSSVSRGLTLTQGEAEHAKVTALWDRQGHHGSSFDPQRRHWGLVVRVKWTRRGGEGDSLFMVVGPTVVLGGLGVDHTAQMQINDWAPVFFLRVINPYEPADAPHVPICWVSTCQGSGQKKILQSQQHQLVYDSHTVDKRFILLGFYVKSNHK